MAVVCRGGVGRILEAKRAAVEMLPDPGVALHRGGLPAAPPNQSKISRKAKNAPAIKSVCEVRGARLRGSPGGQEPSPQCSAGDVCRPARQGETPLLGARDLLFEL